MIKTDRSTTTAGVLGRRLATLLRCAAVRRSPAPAVSFPNRRSPAVTVGGASYAAAHAGRERLVERIRPAEPVTVDVLQPLPGNTSQRVTGRILAEVRVDGQLHHYRVNLGAFVLLCPPAWLVPDSYPAVQAAGLTAPAGLVAA